MKRVSIAIDGPSGAGKSTIAKIVAKEMQFVYVDTGALYRTLALFMLRSGVNIDDNAAVIAKLPEASIDLRYVDFTQRVFLNEEDVSDIIRTPEVSMAASKVSAIPEVRAFLLQLQRGMAEKYSVIMDGRDIGTVVLPGADVKIFLSATAEERARRRYDELIVKDPTILYEDVLADMIQRDHNDSTRAAAPLKPAEDAVMLNTTGNTLEQSVELIKQVIKDAIR